MAKYAWLLAGLVLASYFVGNINFALIISKLKKSDVRKLGSGNPGTLNMSRNFGLKIGLLTLFLDMLKGAIPTLVGYFAFYGVFVGEGTPQFYLPDLAKFACGFAAVLGHIYPVFLKFRGGKGIASTIGRVSGRNERFRRLGGGGHHVHGGGGSVHLFYRIRRHGLVYRDHAAGDRGEHPLLFRLSG